MNHQIRAQAENRGITRLCHVTRSNSLPFILDMGEIVSTSQLRDDEQAIFYPNDNERLDQHLKYVSCSIEYPNAWYLNAIRKREPLFPDWMILNLDPDPLWWDGTLFSPVNAATRRGQFVAEGIDAFNSMFDTFPPNPMASRSLTHLAACPTDNQAEVLVPRGIRIDLIQCIVFADDSQAKREIYRLKAMYRTLEGMPFAVNGDFFNPRVLASRITSGVDTTPECRSI